MNTTLVICDKANESCKTINNGHKCPHSVPHSWYVLEKYSIVGCTYDNLLCPYDDKTLRQCIPVKKSDICYE